MRATEPAAREDQSANGGDRGKNHQQDYRAPQRKSGQKKCHLVFPLAPEFAAPTSKSRLIGLRELSFSPSRIWRKKVWIEQTTCRNPLQSILKPASATNGDLRYKGLRSIIRMAITATITVRF